jgi:hypothetical protein
MAKKRTSSGGAYRPRRRATNATEAGGGLVSSTGAGSGKLGNEKEAELSAIWGSERMGGRQSDRRAPQRKKRRGKGEGSDDDNDGAGSDAGSVMSNLSVDSDGRAKATKSGDKPVTGKKQAAKKAKREAGKLAYKLHCFIAPGTTKNDVREVFEQYEPKVDLKVTQKGNALNKSHYCVLTFTNKAMALHAALKLEGTNQRDTIGINPLHLSMMLTRAQSKLLGRKRSKARRRDN